MKKQKKLVGLAPLGLARTPGGGRWARNDAIASTNRNTARSVPQANIARLPASATTDDKILEIQRAINEVIANMKEARMMDS